MERHHETAFRVAKYLQEHPAVERVLHPLLKDHPDYEIAMKQNGGKHSGLLTFYVKGGESAATALLGEFKVNIPHSPEKCC